MAVVRAEGVAPERGVRDHPKTPGVDADRSQRLAAALAVDDDPVEAPEQTAPEVLPMRSPSRQEIMSGEDRRATRAEQRGVELRRCQPLDVEDIPGDARQPRQADRVLGRFQRQSQPGAPEQP